MMFPPQSAFESRAGRSLLASSAANFLAGVDDVALPSGAQRSSGLRSVTSLHGRAPRPLFQIDLGGRGDPSLAVLHASALRQVSTNCGCALRVLRAPALYTPASCSSTARGEQNAHSRAATDRSERTVSGLAGASHALVSGGSSRRARGRRRARTTRGRPLCGCRPLKHCVRPPARDSGGCGA